MRGVRWGHAPQGGTTKGLINMARTHIISGDGERFEAISTRRFIYRRAITLTILIIVALFLSAAVIGLQRAAIAPSPAPRPADHSLSFADAKKACAIATPNTPAWGACIDLFMRHAWHDDRNSTPEGAVIVKDCISQYRGQELTDCFTQEIG